MALIKCPECGKEISDKAKFCIHCGYPIPDDLKNVIKKSNVIEEDEEEKPSGMATLSVVFGLVSALIINLFAIPGLILGIIALCSGQDKSKSITGIIFSSAAIIWFFIVIWPYISWYFT